MPPQTQRQPAPSHRSLYPSKPAFEAALKIVRQSRAPQIPDVVLALRKELNQPEPDIQAASNLIAQDPILTGRILQTINSPSFGLRAQVTNIQQAVGLMGITRLSNLVTAEAISQMMAVNQGPVRVLWESILDTAATITTLARKGGWISEDEAYLFGIMHHVGSLIFANLLDTYLTEWSFRSDSAPSELVAHEQATLGVDHPLVGFLLASHWKLPEHIALAILHQHTKRHLETDDRRIPYLIALGQLAHYIQAVGHGTQDTAEMQEYRERALEVLDIDDRDWQELCRQVTEGA